MPYSLDYIPNEIYYIDRVRELETENKGRDRMRKFKISKFSQVTKVRTRFHRADLKQSCEAALKIAKSWNQKVYVFATYNGYILTRDLSKVLQNHVTVDASGQVFKCELESARNC